MSGAPAPAPATPDEVAVRVAEAPPHVLGRTVLAVAAMHEPDDRGRCRRCPRQYRLRWWRPGTPYPTWRVIVAELRTGAGPHWVSA